MTRNPSKSGKRTVVISALATMLVIACGGDDARPASFVGTWHDPTGMTLALHADGTATLTNTRTIDAQWSVSGDSIKKLCVGERGAVGADCEVAVVDGNVLTWGTHTMRR